MQSVVLFTFIYTILPEKCHCHSMLDLKKVRHRQKLLWQGHVVTEAGGCGFNCGTALSLPLRLHMPPPPGEEHHLWVQNKDVACLAQG